MKRRKATPAEPTYPIHGLRILEPEKPAPRAELFDQDADVLTDDLIDSLLSMADQIHFWPDDDQALHPYLRRIK